MRTALVIARKDLRQRFRDRSAIVIGVVAPVVIAALMSFAFHGVESFRFTMGVVNLDRGPVAAGLMTSLRAPGLSNIVTSSQLPSVAAARAKVRANKIGAALVIPAGFSAAVLANKPASLTTVRSANNTIAGDITGSIASSFIAQVNADRLSLVSALAAGAPADGISRLAQAVAKLKIPVRAVQRPIGAHELKVISYYSPGMAIFFLFFTITYVARSFFAERSQGLVERMLAAPVRPAEILAGKALSVLIYGGLSLLIVGVVTSFAFGANWGPTLPALVLGAVLVLAVVCLTAFVIGVSKTQRQAEGISSIIVFGLSILGGNFFFISQAPSAMKRLALLTPNGWALRGFTDLATIGGGFGTIAEPVLGIAAFSVIVAAIAVMLAPRAVRA
jgi:linearmycin/streptolysin S transport system permease protein